MNLAELVSRGELLTSELGREYYLTGAGLKSEPQFQQIYQRHVVLLSDEAYEVARASGDTVLLEWLIDLRIGRTLAPLDEQQLVWEQAATVRVNGREIPFLRVPIELQNSPDRAYRIALDAERARVGAAGLNDLHRRRFASEREMMLGHDLGADYVACITSLSGIDLDALGTTAQTLLDRTKDAYADSLARLVKRRLGIPVRELVRADVGWTFRADRFDAAFAPDTLVETALRHMRDMGLDACQNGRVRFDVETREGKQPRAFCSPVCVPDEVYLVIQPSGGHTDYRTFWHELGHAMHFAAVDPSRPFQERWLGDNSVTEGFAMLWDHLTLDDGWLRRYAELSGSDTRELRFELAVAELYMLRRYAAKLRYELAFHRGELDDMSGLYAEMLTDATRFRYPESDYVRDIDPGFYAARYLRAWQLEAAVATSLLERHGEDWYRNPEAGSAVLDLMRCGQADPADRLAQEATGAPLSFDAAVARLEAALS